MPYWKSHGSPGEPAMSGGTLDVDIRTVGGSTVGDTIPVSGTIDISGLSGTLDVDIKTLGGSLVPAGPLPVDIGTTGTVEIGSWEAGTLGVNFSGTMDVDIKTLGGSLVPSGKLPVDATCSTTHVDAVANSLSLADNTSNTQHFWVNTDEHQVFYPVMNFGYDGTYWDRLRTTDAIASGTIDVGLLGIGLVERNHYCVGLFTSSVFTASGTLVPSSAYDCSKFYTKTICHYVDGSASTLQIWARCCDGGTYHNYYQDVNISADTYVTKSFTEALHDAYVKVQIATASGTVWNEFAMQS